VTAYSMAAPAPEYFVYTITQSQ